MERAIAPRKSERLDGRHWPRRTGEPTLKDVARLANVSLATVSNVVNRKYDRMTTDTRACVEGAIATLNYRPMANARALRLERRFIAGMLIVDPAASFLANPFIAQLVAGYSNELWANGYSCLLNGARPDQIENTTFLRYSQTDGLCVFQSGPLDSRRGNLMRLSSFGEPVVAIEEHDLPDGDIASVRQDNFSAGFTLGREMLQRGAKRMVILTTDWIWPAMQDRIAGISAANEALGATVPVDIVRCGDGHASEAAPVISGVLDSLSPTGCVIAGTDRMLAGLGQALSRRSSPQQPLIAAFRGIDDMAATPKNVVVVYQPAYELGAFAARKLMQRIADGIFAERDSVIPLPMNASDFHQV